MCFFVCVYVKFDMWDMKVTEEAADTLREIRSELESAAEGNVMYVKCD